MSVSEVTTPQVRSLASTSRSSRLATAVGTARAGRRAVVLDGHPSDALVEPRHGKVVRLPEFLAVCAADQDAEVLLLDSRRGGRQITPPGMPAPTSPLSLQPASMLELLDAATRTLPHHDHAVITVELPDATERQYVLGQSHDRSPIPLEPGLDVPGVATTLGGLDSDGLLRTAHEARAGKPLSMKRILELKAAEIERVAGRTLIVDRSPAPNGLAGMAGLRYYTESCRSAGVPLDPILLAGVPGVGKTFSFRWLAAQLGLPAVFFGELKGGIVGQTEANFERARRSLEANAPACLLLDEVDQSGLGKRGQNLDSGASDYLRAGILELTNVARELGITFVMATNNPAGMDPAALDRVVVVPCLHPSTNESVEIMLLAAEREGFQLDADAAREVLVSRAGLVTGRQLVRLLRRAARHAASSGHRERVEVDDLRAAAADGIDISDHAAQEYMALSALTLADSQECFPWVAAARLGEPAEVPPYLKPLLNPDGVLDMAAVHARVHQLRSAGHGFHT
jgi:hypothetical protein